MSNDWRVLLPRSALAGILISFAKFASDHIADRYMAALVFSFGLLGVMASGAYLYTGKVGQASYKDWCKLLLILAVNWIAATLCGWWLNPGDVAPARDIGSMIAGAILCGICIEIAVEDKRPAVVILAVMAFVLGGGEHCIVDAYLSAPRWRVLLVAAGNSVGALIVRIGGVA